MVESPSLRAAVMAAATTAADAALSTCLWRARTSHTAAAREPQQATVQDGDGGCVGGPIDQTGSEVDPQGPIDDADHRSLARTRADVHHQPTVLAEIEQAVHALSRLPSG